MQGIQSLMPGQAQQAPMPGMMPKPGAATPPAVVAGLERLPSQQLLQMYSQKPSLQILAALDKAYKREELGQSMRGQQAMQAAQPGTVADQVVSQISNRGIAQFSGGGAVAFRYGGDVQKFSGGANEFGVLANPEAEAMDAMRVERAQKAKQLKVLEETYYSLMMQNDPRAAQVKQQLDSLSGRAPMSSPAVSSAPPRQGKSGIADLDIGPSIAPRTGASAVAQQLGSGQSQQRQQTVPSREVGAAELAAMQQGLSNQASGIRTLSEPSDEERLARQQARQADIARLEEEKKVAREFREGASKQYADVERQVNLPFLENNAQIALLGAGLTGRRGETASGLLKGIGAIEANKQARLDAARKEMREDQRVAMQMESVNRQLSVAQQEKAYADMRGDREGSLAAAEKIATLTNAQNKLAYDYRIKQEEIGIERIKAEAARTSAAKPNETLALLQALFPGQAPSVDNLAKLKSAYTPTAGDRQDVAELKTLQGNLQKQVENILLPKPQRDAAAAQLEQVNAKLAQMAGLGGAPAAAPATQLPPAALSQLKEGVATTFANGQQWTLKNGQPTQVK